MNANFSAPVLLLLACSLASLAISIFVLSRRHASGAAALCILALLIAEWSAAYGQEIAASGLQAKIFWGQLQYIGIAFIPFVWLLFAFFYTRQGDTSRNPVYLYLLGVFPLITTALALTNGAHNLIWRETFIKPVGEIAVLGVRYGGWFWVHFAVSYLFLLGGTIIVLRNLRRMQGLYRAQIWAIFFAVLFPWIGNVVYFVTPIAVDPTPFAFTLTVGLMAWAILGYRLTDIAPIARDLVVDGLREGLVVLDMNAKVVDINPAAARMIGLPAREVLGQPIAEVLSPWPDLIERFRDVSEGEADFSVGQGELIRNYQVRFALLTDSRGNMVGRLISLRELNAAAPAARFAEREPLTQPLRDVAQKDAPDVAAAQDGPASNPASGWLRNFFMPAALDESFMPGNMNKSWEQTIERAVTVAARFIMVFGSIIGYTVLVDLNFQERLGYAVAILLFLACAYFLALARTVSFNFRVWLFLILIYVMALAELLKYGFSADVFVYFMALIVLAHMLLNLRGGMGMLALAVSTMTLFAWSALSGVFEPLEVKNTTGIVLPTDLASATANIIGYLFSALTLMTVVNMFIVNLNQAWKKETQALSLVQQERDLLEERVRERTAELREARDLAMEASRFKSQLVSRVSHELRTPLGSVLGYAELLYQGSFGALSDEQFDAAQNIVASADYLNIMINELLDQAQIEARAVKIHLAPFEPAHLLESIRANMTVLALNKGLRFFSELDPALPDQLIGDEQRLQQVLINLTGNAIKFTSEGEVRVSLLRRGESEWAIRVSDTGAGIPEEARQAIFEPFRQMDNAITRNNRGTGLGLSITRELIELMRGRLELESEVGRGSVFTATLPLEMS